ncbi:uncharacterized protein ARMOST_17726 [Armillaria ostoyae]|uniref:RING-type domain-containing protein n=1 Tax=Armillaria ostoyae TaxID=47428 RepID=A0A284RZU5_ARMOS|nr:uncharacterized protein ARMOST_17726 [Armillaria ostoyae]
MNLLSSIFFCRSVGISSDTSDASSQATRLKETLAAGWSAICDRVCHHRDIQRRYQEDISFLQVELHRASECVAILEWRLEMQIAYTRSLSRRRRNAARHAGRAEDQLKHVEEQRARDEDLFNAQWEENSSLRFRLARLQLREVLTDGGDDHQARLGEESLLCEFCFGTLCHTLAYESLSLLPYLDPPFRCRLRECGHSFCGPCLWLWFQREVESHPDVLRQPTCPECRVPVFFYPTINYRLQTVASQLSRVYPQSDCEGGLAHELGYRGPTSWAMFDRRLRNLVPNM